MLHLRSLLCSALLLSTTFTAVLAAPKYRRDLKHRRGCGTHISAKARTSAEKKFRTHRLPAGDPNSTATLDAYVYIVHANETIEGGYISEDQLKQQFEIINQDYKSTGISFNMANVTYIPNEDWFLRLAPESPEEKELKTQYRHGSASTLNVWTVGFKEGEGAGLLGYATFPSDYESAPTMDGVVLLSSTVPGGLSAPYNEGRTLTHEVGHWAGLYHTFEGGCSGNGDYVDDTPSEREASYGCPKEAPSSCPGGKPDPITNFMNYSDDACMTEFSKGQITRVRTQLRSFRGIEL